MLGTSYLRLNQPDKAIGNLEKALELNPKNTYLYLPKGAANAMLGNFEQAKADFEKYLETNPDATDKEKVLEMLQSVNAQLNKTP